MNYSNVCVGVETVLHLRVSTSRKVKGHFRTEGNIYSGVFGLRCGACGGEGTSQFQGHGESLREGSGTVCAAGPLGRTKEEENL